MDYETKVKAKLNRYNAEFVVREEELLAKLIQGLSKAELDDLETPLVLIPLPDRN